MSQFIHSFIHSFIKEVYSGSWCVTELDSLCTAMNQHKSPQINWYSNARKRDGNGSHCIRATWRSSTSESPVASPTPAMARWRCDYKTLPSSPTKGGMTQRRPETPKVRSTFLYVLSFFDSQISQITLMLARALQCSWPLRWSWARHIGGLRGPLLSLFHMQYAICNINPGCSTDVDVQPMNLGKHWKT